MNLSRLKIKCAALTCTTIMHPALKSLLGMSCHLENQPPERHSSRTGAVEAKQLRVNDRLQEVHCKTTTRIQAPTCYKEHLSLSTVLDIACEARYHGG